MFMCENKTKTIGVHYNLQQFDFFTLTVDIYARNNLKDILNNAGIW